MLTTLRGSLIDDNVDNFRANQLPGATKDIIIHNLINFNQQLIPLGNNSPQRLEYSPWATKGVLISLRSNDYFVSQRRAGANKQIPKLQQLWFVYEMYTSSFT